MTDKEAHVYNNLIVRLRHRGLSNGSTLGTHSGIMDEAADAIEELLCLVDAATKEKKIGYWARGGAWSEHLGHLWGCSCCGTEQHWSREDPAKNWENYCGFCGAKMEVNHRV